MQTKISFDLPESTLRIGFLEAFNINVKPSTEKYQQTITKDIEEMLKPGYAYPDNMQKGIRSLLKTFGFHPSGRSRPASEYLFKDLTNRGSFNYINNIVDINNHISLKYKLPISVFDLDKSIFSCGSIIEKREIDRGTRLDRALVRKGSPLIVPFQFPDHIFAADRDLRLAQSGGCDHPDCSVFRSERD